MVTMRDVPSSSSQCSKNEWLLGVNRDPSSGSRYLPKNGHEDGKIYDSRTTVEQHLVDLTLFHSQKEFTNEDTLFATSVAV